AMKLNPIQPNQTKLTPGPGIFASIGTSSGKRIIVRIAGTNDGFTSFAADTRVGVNSTQKDEPFTDANGNGIWDPGEAYQDTNQNGYFDPGQRAVTIAYIGTQNGRKGVYTNRLNFLGDNAHKFDTANPASFIVGTSSLVVQKDDAIMGL